VTDRDPVDVSFRAHVDLLRSFLTGRDAVVASVERILNAQRKPIRYLQDRAGLANYFEDCFFALAALSGDQRGLRGQLEQAHWASGFRPRQVPGLFNDLIHPAELMVRGFYLWQQTRWPGRNGRLSFAQTLFNLYLIRCLQFLSMRLWDIGPDAAGERLGQVQGLLDELWQGSPADQPVFLRDARWLIPMAQGPTTDGLSAYFDVAERVAETLPPGDSLEVQKAHARMLGGHLTSQIRHYCMKEGVSIDAESVIRRTRTSNALDFALLIQCLVPMLEAYESAVQAGDEARRLEWAGAICQSISPDPELFLARVDLLAPYSMIEHLFVAADRDGQAAYTSMGRRQVRLLAEYGSLIARLTQSLHEDCRHFRPQAGAYSPYGAIFGNPTNLVEDIALKSLQPGTETRFSLEDVFADDGLREDKLAWVAGWRQLPHIDPEVQQLYAYPQEFAEQIFERVERELARCDSGDEPNNPVATGRLFLQPEGGSLREPAGSESAEPPAGRLTGGDLPIEYIDSSDEQIVAAGRAQTVDEGKLLRDRLEGYFLVSYESANGWVALRKDLVTEVLGAGRDAQILSLPPEGARILELMCLGLAVKAKSSG
jgi:hypothetical protein